jgi:hypothetical protein
MTDSTVVLDVNGDPLDASTARPSPLRGLVFALAILLIFPGSRHTILTAAGMVAAAVVGGLLVLLVLGGNRRRGR